MDHRVAGLCYYVKTFADYNAMYGSIGAIIVLLLYFYISAAVLLLGAEMNAVIEHMSAEGKTPVKRISTSTRPRRPSVFWAMSTPLRARRRLPSLTPMIRDISRWATSACCASPRQCPRSCWAAASCSNDRRHV